MVFVFFLSFLGFVYDLRVDHVTFPMGGAMIEFSEFTSICVFLDFSLSCAECVSDVASYLPLLAPYWGSSSAHALSHS